MEPAQETAEIAEWLGLGRSLSRIEIADALRARRAARDAALRAIVLSLIADMKARREPDTLDAIATRARDFHNPFWVRDTERYWEGWRQLPKNSAMILAELHPAGTQPAPRRLSVDREPVAPQENQEDKIIDAYLRGQ